MEYHSFLYDTHERFKDIIEASEVSVSLWSIIHSYTTLMKDLKTS